MDADDEDPPKTVSRYRRVVVSYDVRTRRRSVVVRVAEHAFGTKIKVRTKKGNKVYRYDGLVMKPKVERPGQSALIMSEKDAEDFHTFLAGPRVPHTRLPVWTEL